MVPKSRREHIFKINPIPIAPNKKGDAPLPRASPYFDGTPPIKRRGEIA
jgi:hypothetical protein